MYNRMGDLVMTDRERTLAARRNADSRCTDNTRNLGRRLGRARCVLLLTHRDRHYAYIRELKIVGTRHKLKRTGQCETRPFFDACRERPCWPRKAQKHGPVALRRDAAFDYFVHYRCASDASHRSAAWPAVRGYKVSVGPEPMSFSYYPCPIIL